MDSGKSTLVAVLTHGVGGRPLLDNGHGSARMAVFRHKHEVESGRTSSISQQTLGYDATGTHQLTHLRAVHTLRSTCVRNRITASPAIPLRGCASPVARALVQRALGFRHRAKPYILNPKPYNHRPFLKRAVLDVGGTCHRSVSDETGLGSGLRV